MSVLMAVAGAIVGFVVGFLVFRKHQDKINRVEEIVDSIKDEKY